MRQLIFAFGTLVIIVILLILFNGSGIQLFNFGKSPSATINNRTFNVKVVKTLKDRQVGLSATNNLPENQGMLFVFEKKDIYPFWMRNMKFPIDIIFIDDNKVVEVIKDAQPPKPGTPISELTIYRPQSKANYVLEINAGLSERYAIKKGDMVTFKNL